MGKYSKKHKCKCKSPCKNNIPYDCKLPCKYNIQYDCGNYYCKCKCKKKCPPKPKCRNVYTTYQNYSVITQWQTPLTPNYNDCCLYNDWYY